MMTVGLVRTSDSAVISVFLDCWIACQSGHLCLSQLYLLLGGNIKTFQKHVLLNSTFYPCHFSHFNSEKKGILNLEHS